jgi:hypothetical protein
MYTPHTGKFFNRVLLVIAFFTALFTTVHAANINLALGKSATQSSIYNTTLYHASQAVNGNTQGIWYNNSITHTQKEQGAWWQVDLGSEKNIHQIIIHNRTDCCAGRLSNYQVSISNKVDFSTHTYQQDFHGVPNPKKTIKLSTQGKRGRYVKIQLLDNNYLSLAEVQVMGVDLLRFSEVDFSSAYNDFGGNNNAFNGFNSGAFAAIKGNGSIIAWGDSKHGGTGAPAGSDYTKIYSNKHAFAALKANGSIAAWGNSNLGGAGAPTGSGYTKIYSTDAAFAALKTDGSITAWGDSNSGGASAPTDSGYTKIYSNRYAFSALKADGSITAWAGWGGLGLGGIAPTDDSGYTKIYSTDAAFAALKTDGVITAWGHSDFGGKGAPTDGGYIKIYSTGCEGKCI